MNIELGVQQLHPQYNCPAIPVHGTAACGKEFINIAWVLEPDSQNPCIALNGPLGMDSLEKIIKRFRGLSIPEPSEN